MKKDKIKPLPFVKELSDYFLRRAKRALKLKNSDFKASSISLHPERGTIWVWFYGPEKVIGYAQFKFDGQRYRKTDNRKEGLETEIVTQGKPEDA